MSQDMNLNPAEQALEASLAQLRPMRPGLQALDILLAARLRRASRQVWIWRAAAALLAIAAGVGLMRRPVETTRTVERIVYQPAPPAPIRTAQSAPLLPWLQNQLSPAPANDNYLDLRNRVLAAGLAVLPGRAPDGAAATRHDARKQPTVTTWNPFDREQL